MDESKNQDAPEKSNGIGMSGQVYISKSVKNNPYAQNTVGRLAFQHHSNQSCQQKSTVGVPKQGPSAHRQHQAVQHKHDHPQARQSCGQKISFQQKSTGGIPNQGLSMAGGTSTQPSAQWQHPKLSAHRQHPKRQHPRLSAQRQHEAVPHKRDQPQARQSCGQKVSGSAPKQHNRQGATPTDNSDQLLFLRNLHKNNVFHSMVISNSTVTAERQPRFSNVIELSNEIAIKSMWNFSVPKVPSYLKDATLADGKETDVSRSARDHMNIVFQYILSLHSACWAFVKLVEDKYYLRKIEELKGNKLAVRNHLSFILCFLKRFYYQMECGTRYGDEDDEYCFIGNKKIVLSPHKMPYSHDYTFGVVGRVKSPYYKRVKQYVTFKSLLRDACKNLVEECEAWIKLACSQLEEQQIFLQIRVTDESCIETDGEEKYLLPDDTVFSGRTIPYVRTLETRILFGCKEWEVIFSFHNDDDEKFCKLQETLQEKYKLKSQDKEEQPPTQNNKPEKNVKQKSHDVPPAHDNQTVAKSQNKKDQPTTQNKQVKAKKKRIISDSSPEDNVFEQSLPDNTFSEISKDRSKGSQDVGDHEESSPENEFDNDYESSKKVSKSESNVKKNLSLIFNAIPADDATKSRIEGKKDSETGSKKLPEQSYQEEQKSNHSFSDKDRNAKAHYSQENPQKQQQNRDSATSKLAIFKDDCFDSDSDSDSDNKHTCQIQTDDIVIYFEAGYIGRWDKLRWGYVKSISCTTEEEDGSIYTIITLGPGFMEVVDSQCNSYVAVYRKTDRGLIDVTKNDRGKMTSISSSNVTCIEGQSTDKKFQSSVDYTSEVIHRNTAKLNSRLSADGLFNVSEDNISQPMNQSDKSDEIIMAKIIRRYVDMFKRKEQKRDDEKENPKQDMGDQDEECVVEKVTMQNYQSKTYQFQWKEFFTSFHRNFCVNEVPANGNCGFVSVLRALRDFFKNNQSRSKCLPKCRPEDFTDTVNGVKPFRKKLHHFAVDIFSSKVDNFAILSNDEKVHRTLSLQKIQMEVLDRIWTKDSCGKKKRKVTKDHWYNQYVTPLISLMFQVTIFTYTHLHDKDKITTSVSFYREHDKKVMLFEFGVGILPLKNSVSIFFGGKNHYQWCQMIGGKENFSVVINLSNKNAPNAKSVPLQEETNPDYHGADKVTLDNILSPSPLGLCLPKGMVNESNVCYFISILQSLLHSPGWVQSIISANIESFYHDDASLEKFAMLQTLIWYYHQKDVKAIAGSIINYLVVTFMGDEHGFERNDPHEAYMKIIACLDTTVNANFPNLTETLTCTRCHHPTTQCQLASTIEVAYPILWLEPYKKLPDPTEMPVKRYDDINTKIDTIPLLRMLEDFMSEKLTAMCEQCGHQEKVCNRALSVTKENKDSVGVFFYIKRLQHSYAKDKTNLRDKAANEAICTGWGLYYNKQTWAKSGRKEETRIRPVNSNKFSIYDRNIAKYRGSIQSGVKLPPTLRCNIENTTDQCELVLSSVIAFVPHESDNRNDHYVTYVRSLHDGITWFKIDDDGVEQLNNNEVDHVLGIGEKCEPIFPVLVQYCALHGAVSVEGYLERLNKNLTTDSDTIETLTENVESQAKKLDYLSDVEKKRLDELRLELFKNISSILASSQITKSNQRQENPPQQEKGDEGDATVLETNRASISEGDDDEGVAARVDVKEVQVSKGADSVSPNDEKDAVLAVKNNNIVDSAESMSDQKDESSFQDSGTSDEKNSSDSKNPIIAEGVIADAIKGADSVLEGYDGNATAVEKNGASMSEGDDDDGVAARVDVKEVEVSKGADSVSPNDEKDAVTAGKNNNIEDSAESMSDQKDKSSCQDSGTSDEQNPSEPKNLIIAEGVIADAIKGADSVLEGYDGDATAVDTNGAGISEGDDDDGVAAKVDVKKVEVSKGADSVSPNDEKDVVTAVKNNNIDDSAESMSDQKHESSCQDSGTSDEKNSSDSKNPIIAEGVLADAIKGADSVLEGYDGDATAVEKNGASMSEGDDDDGVVARVDVKEVEVSKGADSVSPNDENDAVTAGKNNNIEDSAESCEKETSSDCYKKSENGEKPENSDEPSNKEAQIAVRDEEKNEVNTMAIPAMTDSNRSSEKTEYCILVVGDESILILGCPLGDVASHCNVPVQNSQCSQLSENVCRYMTEKKIKVSKVFASLGGIKDTDCYYCLVKKMCQKQLFQFDATTESSNVYLTVSLESLGGLLSHVVELESLCVISFIWVTEIYNAIPDIIENCELLKKILQGLMTTVEYSHEMSDLWEKQYGKPGINFNIQNDPLRCYLKKSNERESEPFLIQLRPLKIYGPEVFSDKNGARIYGDTKGGFLPLDKYPVIEYSGRDSSIKFIKSNILRQTVMTFHKEFYEKKLNTKNSPRVPVGEIAYSATTQKYSLSTIRNIITTVYSKSSLPTSASKIKTLEDGISGKDINNCVDVDDIAKELFAFVDYYQPSKTLRAGNIHRSVESLESDFMVYPGHKDKRYFETVAFFPLNGFFWALLANDSGESVKDDQLMFNEWIASSDKAEEIKKYVEQFRSDATSSLHKSNFTIQYYKLEPGNCLFFNASNIFHSTITPKQKLSSHRELLIMHSLQGEGVSLGKKSSIVVGSGDSLQGERASDSENKIPKEMCCFSDCIYCAEGETLNNAPMVPCNSCFLFWHHCACSSHFISQFQNNQRCSHRVDSSTCYLCIQKSKLRLGEIDQLFNGKWQRTIRLRISNISMDKADLFDNMCLHYKNQYVVSTRMTGKKISSIMNKEILEMIETNKQDLQKWNDAVVAKLKNNKTISMKSRKRKGRGDENIVEQKKTKMDVVTKNVCHSKGALVDEEIQCRRGLKKRSRTNDNLENGRFSDGERTLSSVGKKRWTSGEHSAETCDSVEKESEDLHSEDTHLTRNFTPFDNVMFDNWPGIYVKEIDASSSLVKDMHSNRTHKIPTSKLRFLPNARDKRKQTISKVTSKTSPSKLPHDRAYYAVESEESKKQHTPSPTGNCCDPPPLNKRFHFHYLECPNDTVNLIHLSTYASLPPSNMAIPTVLSLARKQLMNKLTTYLSKEEKSLWKEECDDQYLIFKKVGTLLGQRFLQMNEDSILAFFRAVSCKDYRTGIEIPRVTTHILIVPFQSLHLTFDPEGQDGKESNVGDIITICMTEDSNLDNLFIIHDGEKKDDLKCHVMIFFFVDTAILTSMGTVVKLIYNGEKFSTPNSHLNIRNVPSCYNSFIHCLKNNQKDNSDDLSGMSLETLSKKMVEVMKGDDQMVHELCLKYCPSSQSLGDYKKNKIKTFDILVETDNSLDFPLGGEFELSLMSRVFNVQVVVVKPSGQLVFATQEMNGNLNSVVYLLLTNSKYPRLFDRSKDYIFMPLTKLDGKPTDEEKQSFKREQEVIEMWLGTRSTLPKRILQAMSPFISTKNERITGALSQSISLQKAEKRMCFNGLINGNCCHLPEDFPIPCLTMDDIRKNQSGQSSDSNLTFTQLRRLQGFIQCINKTTETICCPLPFVHDRDVPSTQNLYLSTLSLTSAFIVYSPSLSSNEEIGMVARSLASRVYKSKSDTITFPPNSQMLLLVQMPNYQHIKKGIDKQEQLALYLESSPMCVLIFKPDEELKEVLVIAQHQFCHDKDNLNILFLLQTMASHLIKVKKIQLDGPNSTNTCLCDPIFFDITPSSDLVHFTDDSKWKDVSSLSISNEIRKKWPLNSSLTKVLRMSVKDIENENSSLSCEAQLGMKMKELLKESFIGKLTKMTIGKHSETMKLHSAVFNIIQCVNICSSKDLLIRMGTNGQGPVEKSDDEKVSFNILYSFSIAHLIELIYMELMKFRVKSFNPFNNSSLQLVLLKAAVVKPVYSESSKKLKYQILCSCCGQHVLNDHDGFESFTKALKDVPKFIIFHRVKKFLSMTSDNDIFSQVSVCNTNHEELDSCFGDDHLLRSVYGKKVGENTFFNVFVNILQGEDNLLQLQSGVECLLYHVWRAENRGKHLPYNILPYKSHCPIEATPQKFFDLKKDSAHDLLLRHTVGCMKVDFKSIDCCDIPKDFDERCISLISEKDLRMYMGFNGLQCFVESGLLPFYLTKCKGMESNKLSKSILALPSITYHHAYRCRIACTSKSHALQSHQTRNSFIVVFESHIPLCNLGAEMTPEIVKEKEWLESLVKDNKDMEVLDCASFETEISRNYKCLIIRFIADSALYSGQNSPLSSGYIQSMDNLEWQRFEEERGKSSQLIQCLDFWQNSSSWHTITTKQVWPYAGKVKNLSNSDSVINGELECRNDKDKSSRLVESIHGCKLRKKEVITPNKEDARKRKRNTVCNDQALHNISNFSQSLSKRSGNDCAVINLDTMETVFNAHLRSLPNYSKTQIKCILTALLLQKFESTELHIDEDENTEQRDREKRKKELHGTFILPTVGFRGTRIVRQAPKVENTSLTLQYPVLEGNFNCLSANIANALFLLNDAESARAIMANKSFGSFNPNAGTKCKPLHKVVALTLRRLGYQVTNRGTITFEQCWELLQRENCPLFMLLKNENSMYQHIVTVVPKKGHGNSFEYHLIDGSHPEHKSMPFNCDNLDWCCGDGIHCKNMLVYTFKQSKRRQNSCHSLLHTFFQTELGYTVLRSETIMSMDLLLNYITGKKLPMLVTLCQGDKSIMVCVLPVKSNDDETWVHHLIGGSRNKTVPCSIENIRDCGFSHDDAQNQRHSVFVLIPFKRTSHRICKSLRRANGDDLKCVTIICDKKEAERLPRHLKAISYTSWKDTNQDVTISKTPSVHEAYFKLPYTASVEEKNSPQSNVCNLLTLIGDDVALEKFKHRTSSSSSAFVFDQELGYAI